MDQRYSTVIFTPGKRAPFLKLKVSHRLIFIVISIVTSALVVNIFLTMKYYQSARQAEFYSNATKSSRALEQELAAANAQVIRSMQNVEAASAHLIQQRRESERHLAELQHRYEALRALAAGQEQIAEAHRAILEDRPFREKLLQQVTAFLVGVLSSLVATFLWVITKSKPVGRVDGDVHGVDK